MNVKKLVGPLSFLLLAQSAFAGSGPQSFIYHGSVLSQNGTTPVTQPVDIIFDILAPNGCLLYEEHQSGIDLSLTNGKMAVPVGSPIGSAVRTSSDPGFSMSDIFSNGKVIPTSANCAGGYTGQDGDIKKLHVSISVSGGAFIALSPDVPLTSAPSSFSSDTLQGKKPSAFAQIDSTVTQANLDSLTNGSDASALHNHDATYVKKTDSPSFTAAQVTSVGSSASSVVNKDYVTSQISSAVSPLAKQADLVTLQGQVSALPTTSVMNSAISSATANLATTAALNSAIAPLATTASVNTAIAPLATSASVSTLSTSVQQNTSDITTLKNTAGGNPAGTVINFAGAACPTGYLKADGTSYAISTYQSLAQALYDSTNSRYIWGSVDGTHFNVPDMRGEFIRGMDSAGFRDPNASSRTNISGTTVGGVVGSYESDQMQGHNHSYSDPGHKHWSMSNMGADYVGWGYGNPTGGVSAVNGTALAAGNNRTSPEVTNITIQGPTSDGTNGTPRIGTESRPKNVMMNMCVKY